MTLSNRKLDEKTQRSRSFSVKNFQNWMKFEEKLSDLSEIRGGVPKLFGAV